MRIQFALKSDQQFDAFHGVEAEVKFEIVAGKNALALIVGGTRSTMSARCTSGCPSILGPAH